MLPKEWEKSEAGHAVIIRNLAILVVNLHHVREIDNLEGMDEARIHIVTPDLHHRPSVCKLNSMVLNHHVMAGRLCLGCLYGLGSIGGRWFWVSVLVASGAGLALMLRGPVTSQLSYTPDSRYLRWTTTYPAVTVCETLNPSATQKKITRIRRK